MSWAQTFRPTFFAISALSSEGLDKRVRRDDRAAGQLSTAGIGEGVGRASPCRLSASGDAKKVEGAGGQCLKSH